MTRVNASNPAPLLLATGPVFACATSIFAALIVAIALLACVAGAVAATRFFSRTTGARALVATTTSAIVIATLLIGLIMLGFSDVVAAFAPQLVLTAFAAVLIANGDKPASISIESVLQIATVGLVCEVLGRSTLFGDYEIAFAGATHAWLVRIVDFAPLPWLATPAGGLLAAAIVIAAQTLWRTRRLAPPAVTAAITEPRSGRRVRVTGHIS